MKGPERAQGLRSRLDRDQQHRRSPSVFFLLLFLVVVVIERSRKVSSRVACNRETFLLLVRLPGTNVRWEERVESIDEKSSGFRLSRFRLGRFKRRCKRKR